MNNIIFILHFFYTSLIAFIYAEPKIGYMKKTTTLFLTNVLAVIALIISMFFVSSPVRAEEYPVFDDSYKSVHQYMSMHLVDPNKTGPEFLHEDTPRETVRAAVAQETMYQTETTPAYSFERDTLPGVITAFIFILLFVQVWRVGKESDWFKTNGYRLSH